MGLYDRYILPRLIEWAMRDKAVAEQRGKVIPQAAGRVLEIGIGSGLNLRYYDTAKVHAVVGVDPSVELRRRAEARAHKVPFSVELLTAGGESIPLADASADCAVCTYTLCSIPDRAQALREVLRVLKPGARLFFSEHGLAPDTAVARWQQRLEPAWKHLSGGCHLTVPTTEVIQEAGFAMEDFQTTYLPGPKPMTFTYWGSARKP